MSQETEENIPSYFNKDYFKDVLQDGLRQTDLTIHGLKIEKLKLGGENYCSFIYQARIQFSNKNDEEKLEKFVIIKSMPKARQATLVGLQIYLKETIFYLDIKPKLETLMWHLKGTSWKIGASHLCSTTSPEETIIFENLCRAGFELQSRQIGLDFEHSKLVLKKLAEYHALTMIMAEREPQTLIDRFPFGLLNMHSIKSPNFKELSKAQFLTLANLIEKYPGYQIIATKLRGYYENFEDRLTKAIYPMEGAFNVLNHGDMWVNNFFFKYDPNNRPMEVQFIDFQLCYYGSPGFDINYFYVTSVQVEVLKSQRHKLNAYYYENLVKILKDLPFESSLPSYENLLKEIQEREAYGLFAAIVFFPLMSMANFDSQDVSLDALQDAEFVNRKIELMFTSNPRTLDTLMYLLRRACDLGILD